MANTDFIQGDGTRQTNASVQISWLNVNPDAVFSQPTKVVNTEAIFGFQVDILNIPDYQVSLQWVVSPPLPASCFPNTMNRTQLVFNASCMRQGQAYTATANILYNPR